MVGVINAGQIYSKIPCIIKIKSPAESRAQNFKSKAKSLLQERDSFIFFMIILNWSSKKAFLSSTATSDELVLNTNESLSFTFNNANNFLVNDLIL